DTIDVIAFAPHPDDAELYCAGTLALLKKEGKSIGIADITRGELSTRGSLVTRETEVREASRILDLDLRLNLDIPDGNIENSLENRTRVVAVIRRYRPRLVLLPYYVDRHPDHVHASALVQESLFYSGLEKFADKNFGTPYRPLRALYYMLAEDFSPQFIIDVSETFDKRLEAIRAYRSQFSTPGHEDNVDIEPETYVSRPDFVESIIARARRLGFLAGGKYGEGFRAVQPLVLRAACLL
ncbi:MAG: bacillithiol biosynthesis deacetylase BshB1, partial [Chlorobi bacterium]|nr:bacillithiol biosynthesis deacetylase BshB1 [Chlorobiota bacterium]